MSAVFTSVTDPTRGHSLVAMRDDNLETTRYLFIAGQLLDPERLFQIEHLRNSGGGEEVQSHCLRRTIGGFIPRAFLTPMEVWAEPIPPILLSDGAERDAVRIQGPTTPELLGVDAKRRAGGLAGVGAPLVYHKYYPGDEISSVLKIHESKGLVEVKSLAGQKWYEDEGETRPGLPQLLNRDFFPTRPPETLNGLRETIDKKASESDIHRSVAGEMDHSCNQFERWAQARLAAEHTLLRQRTSPSGQHTYTYSPLAYELLKQLEMKPQDTIMEQAAGISAEQLQAIVKGAGGGGHLDATAIAQIVGQVTREILAAQAEQKAKETDDDRGDGNSGAN